jgi:hypothetical protein
MRDRLAALLMAVLLAAGLASATLLAVRQPLSQGDYLAVWGLKARSIYASGRLSSVFRVDPQAEYSHPAYPPLWPLLLAGTATALGRYDELLLSLLRPALLLLAAGLTAARTRASLPWKLGAAAALSLLPYFQTSGYAGYAENLLVVLVLAGLLVLEGNARSRATPAVAGIVLALAALTKQEGIAVLLVVSVVLFASRRFLDAAVLAAVGAGFGVVPWALFRASHSVAPSAVYGADAFAPAKLVQAVEALGRAAAPASLPWFVGAGLLIALAPSVRARRRPLLAGAAAYSALLVASFAFARIDVPWFVTWSWDRLLLVPVVALLPALVEAAAEPFAPPDE